MAIRLTDTPSSAVKWRNQRDWLPSLCVGEIGGSRIIVWQIVSLKLNYPVPYHWSPNTGIGYLSIADVLVLQDIMLSVY